MIDSFSIFVEYTQILVHTASHPTPGLLWTDDHVAQGFAWAEGIVSFGVPDHDGECLINISEVSSDTLAPTTLWAVQTPFHVSETLSIGTVFDTRLINVPQGTYNLIFEALPKQGEYAFVINLKFLLAENPQFSILKQGIGTLTDVILRKDADLGG